MQMPILNLYTEVSMKFCRKFIFFMLFLTGNIVSAKSFSLQVIQKNGAENIVYNASYLVEQTIMDYFFENAYIVSNSPVIIEKKNESITAELQKSFDAAQEGCLDYIIEATIFYNLENSNNPEEALISNIDKIEWKVFSLNDRQLIANGKSVPQKYRNDDESLVFFANEIAQNIQKVIETKGGRK